MLRFINVIPQYFIPQHFLTSVVFRLTRLQNKLIKNALIRIFIKVFSVDMTPYARKTTEDYNSFNDFFTRELLKESISIATNSDIISPVDGYISQYGNIEQDELIQAKGKSFTLHSLLANQQVLTDKYIDGEFTTLYLSPKNYHRIHMPMDGSLTKMTYVPGRLFAVNQHTAKTVNNLFGRNERVIIEFTSNHGEFCLIMVGALFVGSMETVWHGQITPAKSRIIAEWQYDPDLEQHQFAKGDEIGRFNMGSTVILLFKKNSIHWLESLSIDQEIRMGLALADFRKE